MTLKPRILIGADEESRLPTRRAVMGTACAAVLSGLTAACSKNKINVLNPDFESGAVAPWIVFQSVVPAITSAQAHSGRYSLAESGGAGSVYQDVKGVAPDVSHTASAWVSGAPGSTATVMFAIYDPMTNIAVYSPAMTVGEAWQNLKFTFKTKSQSFVRLHLIRTEGTGTVYWDDIELTREA